MSTILITGCSTGIGFAAYFAASLQNHVQPVVVSEVVRKIIDGTRQQFRNPEGPNAAPLLPWRATTPDEAWVASTDMDNDTRKAGMEQIGPNPSAYMNQPMDTLFKSALTT